MPNSIELSDLNNKPFYDFNKTDAHELPKRAYLYIFFEMMFSIILCTEYSAVALVYPLLAPILLGSSTAALAQLLNQYWKHKFSDKKVIKFIVWGAINSYFTTLWIDFLVLNVPKASSRILLDQLVGAPLFQLTFTVLSSFADSDIPNPKFTSRATYFRSLKYSYCYWPFVSTAMFTLIPPRFMFMSNCLANFIWNMILSKIA